MSLSPCHCCPQARLLLDTNDPRMTFTALNKRADAALRARAAAVILPFVPKPKIVTGPPVAAGATALELARFNFSKDSTYQLVRQQGP